MSKRFTTPKKNNDVILVDSSDDEAADGDKKPAAKRTLDEIGDSPFGKVATADKVAKSGSDDNTIVIFHVDPELVEPNAPAGKRGIPGMAMVIYGELDKKFCVPQYNRESYGKFLDKSFVVKHVFDLCIDGVMQYNDSKKHIRTLIWTFDKNPNLNNQASCEAIMNHWFNSIRAIGILKKGDVTTYDPEVGYHKVSTWSNVIDRHSQFGDLFKFRLRDSYGNIASVFKFCKNNLYSFYTPGKVPLDVIKRFRLGKQKYIEPADMDEIVVFREAQRLSEPVDNDCEIIGGEISHGRSVPTKAGAAKKTAPAITSPGPFEKDKTDNAIRTLTGTANENPDTTDDNEEGETGVPSSNDENAEDN